MADNSTPPRTGRGRGRPRKQNHSPAIPGEPQYYSDGGSNRKKSQKPVYPTDGTSDYSPAAIAPTPAKQAYAGATFQNSPAASSLPMPRMFSKSVPSPGPTSSLQSQVDASNENLLPQSPSPAQRPSSGRQPPAREQSPLDMLFSAHKAEQSRKQNSASPLSKPPLAPLDPQNTYQRGQLQHSSQQRPGTQRVPSSRDMFLMEMDGNTEDDASDANNPPSMPFKERINALRTSQSAPPKPEGLDEEERVRREKTAALKKLLMADPQAAQHAGYPHPADHSRNGVAGGQYSHGDPFSPYSQPRHVSGRQPHPAYPTPPPPPPSGPSDVQSMENDLRRILKLDGPSNSMG